MARTRIPVPTRPTTDDQDYTLGPPGWMDEFAAGNDMAGRNAEILRSHGQVLAGDARAAQSRATPTTDFSASRATGGQQVGAADWLSQFAQGPQGPSAAQAQLRMGANQAMQQNLGIARAGSGFGESANNIEAAQRQNSTVMSNAANQAAILRAQEDQAFRQQQLQAETAAAGIYGGAAERQGAQSQFLTQSELEAAAQRDALQLGLTGQSIEAQNAGTQNVLAAEDRALNAQQAALEGRIAQGQTEANLYGTEADVFATREARDRALAEQRRRNRGEAAGFIGKAAGAVASVFSDERTKTKARATDLRERYRDLY